MPAKPIAPGGTAENLATRAEPAALPAAPQPSIDRCLDLLAAEIAADAWRTSAEAVERFNTHQQGE